MAAFEISVNGERRFVGDDVKAITLVSDWVAFHSVIAHNAPLPIGASIQEQGDASCGFCQKAPPEVAGLFVRNAAALCPECLRACLDLLTVPGDERG